MVSIGVFVRAPMVMDIEIPITRLPTLHHFAVLSAELLDLVSASIQRAFLGRAGLAVQPEKIASLLACIRIISRFLFREGDIAFVVGLIDPPFVSVQQGEEAV